MNSYNNNENNDELFADLFAYRFALLDLYETNEIEIIRKLKYKLIEWNYNRTEINGLLADFYRFYEIPVELTEIENVRILLLDFRVFEPLEQQEQEQEQEISSNAVTNYFLNSIPSFISLLREIRDQEQNEQQQEDVKITVDEEALNNLTSIIIEDELEINCPICIEGLNKGDEAIQLTCNHYFHKDCIKTHLLNYDYKCPLCRCDVGNHKYS